MIMAEKTTADFSTAMDCAMIANLIEKMKCIVHH